MKTIYCIGDSFTQGTELADAEYYGDVYPGYSTFHSNDKLRREINRQWWNINSPSVNNSYILLDKENARAWPAKLAKHMHNVSVINAGKQGKSMQYIVDTCIKDIITKKFEIDLVIVQLTDPVRLEFSENGSSFTIFLQNSTTYKNQEALRKALLNIENDKSLYFRWITHLARVQDFCKANNIPLLFVDSVNVEFPYLVTSAEFSYIRDYVNKPVLSLRDIADAFSLDTEVLAAGGHFTEIVHDKFAEELSKIIKDRNLI
jgi:hypothetical protein